MKKQAYFLFLFSVLFLTACGGGESLSDEEFDVPLAGPIERTGNTQGTTYAIICNDSIRFEKKEIDAILANFDQALSGYIDASVVSKLNNAGPGTFSYEDDFNYFRRCYEMAWEVYEVTGGAFDPTVYPLVDGWGFMKDVENVPDSSRVDSLRRLVSFEDGYHFSYEPEKNETTGKYEVIKNTRGAKLDFNAIAQGLAVDVLAEEIERRGGENYFVEIGGEIRVKGVNSSGREWSIGIDKPIEKSDANSRELQEIVVLSNKSIATSGSYRKFYEKDGVKYSHTLNPYTGYPVTHSMLSATVVMPSCAFADAYATAFMVMGFEKSKAFFDAHPELHMEVYFIFINEYDEYETFYSNGFEKMIVL